MGIRNIFPKKSGQDAKMTGTSVASAPSSSVNSIRSVDGGKLSETPASSTSRLVNSKDSPSHSPSIATDNQSVFSMTRLSRQSSSSSENSLLLANNGPNQITRVTQLPNGKHTHLLKNARRQEKLRRMLRDIMGGTGMRVGDNAVSAVPDFVKQVDRSEHRLSLMHGLVNKLNGTDPKEFKDVRDPKDSRDHKEFRDHRDGSTIPGFREDTLKSLVEKYGRCQEIVGKGSYGVVRVAHKNLGAGREQLFAVKEFRKRTTENIDSYHDRLMSEFCISSSLDHININQTLDLMKDANGGCCQVMEYCAGGDLYSLVLSSGSVLTEVESDCFIKQILRCVVYMHSMGVAHCDLKPENILLTQNGVCKISDFGNGECFRMAWEKEIHFSRGVCGSGPYIAPEEFRKKSFDPRAVDIWAVGVIYMVMRTGSYLWRKAVAEEDDHYSRYLSDRKTEKGFAPVERLSPSKSVYVVYSILDPVPSRRITGKQILNSEWCRGITVCDVAEPKDTNCVIREKDTPNACVAQQLPSQPQKA